MSHAPDTGRYERSDAHARPLFWFGFALALLLALSLAVSAWINAAVTREIQGEERASPVRALRKPPEGPGLQAVPARELELQRAWEERLLSSTEWIDPLNQIARIPIEHAIELTLQAGLPARAEAPK